MKKRTIYSIFFVTLLTTEFYYISIGGGIARIYHFAVILVILALARRIPELFSSRVFWALLGFWGINFLAALLSSAPTTALASFLSLSANIGVAITVALILISGRVDFLTLKRIIYTVTLLSIGWALMQIVIFRLAGVSLSLSVEQEGQILIGFGPAFRTEANSFGKYLIVPFLLFLPEFVKNRRNKYITLFYAILIVGILAVFTRSSIYGLGLALLFIVSWYFARGQFSIFVRRSSKIVGMAVAGLFLFLSGLLGFSDYALYKFGALFNPEEILEGGSSSFRIMAMENTLDKFLADEKTILIGNGWGQVYMDYGGELIQTGGSDLLTTLGYGGLLGGGAYLLFMVFAFFSALRVAKSSPDHDKALFAEGVMFALLGIFFASQMAGYLIAPEYWLLIGACIYLSVNSHKRPAHISAEYR